MKSEQRNISIIQFGIGGIIAFSILTFGAGEVWAFSVVEMVLFFVLFLCIFDALRTGSFRMKKDPIWLPLILFIVIVLIQSLPVPSPILKVLSPSTYHLYQEILPRYSDINIDTEAVPNIAQNGEKETLQHPLAIDKPVQTAKVSDNYSEHRKWRQISINNSDTLTILLKVLVYIGLFFIFVQFDWPVRRSGRIPFFTGLVWLIFLIGLFNALFFFIQKASGMQIQWLGPFAPPTGNCLGTFKAYNNFSEFLEMVVPLSMGLLILQNYRETRKIFFRKSIALSRVASLFSKSGLLSFGIILTISALLLSLVKGGFITFPITMCVLFFFVTVSYWIHDRWPLVLFSIVFVMAAVYLLWLGIEPILHELQFLFVDLGPQGRIVTYKDALTIIKDFPIFGVGLGNWKHIILKYHTMIGRETWMPAIAYNDTLQLLAETGVLGTVCVFSFLIIIYRKAIMALKRGKNFTRQALILGGLASMSAALIHCQFDNFFTLPSHAMVFAVVAGMTYRLSKEELRNTDS